jgi:hypothetical protein
MLFCNLYVVCFFLGILTVACQIIFSRNSAVFCYHSNREGIHSVSFLLLKKFNNEVLVLQKYVSYMYLSTSPVHKSYVSFTIISLRCLTEF